MLVSTTQYLWLSILECQLGGHFSFDSETASILGALGLKGQPLDVRIRKLADERDDLGDTVRRLKVFKSNCSLESKVV